MKLLFLALLFIPEIVFAQPRYKPMDVPLPVEGNRTFGSPCVFPQELIPTQKHGADTALTFRIGSDRVIADVAILRSSGDPILDEAATRCVKKWQVNQSTSVMFAWFTVDPSTLSVGEHKMHVLWAMACGVGETLSRAWCGFPAPIVIPPKPIGYRGCNNFYPRSAYEGGIEGTTLVEYRVTVDGRVLDPEVAKSSGKDSLDQAALDCVTTWHFQPATWDNAPREIRTESRIVWRSMR